MVALYLANFKGISILIAYGVGRVHRISNALCVEVSPCNVRIIVGSVSGAVLAGRVPWEGFGPWDIINLVRFLGLGLIVPVPLGLGPGNVAHIHLVPNELWWCDRPHLYLSERVCGVQGISRSPISSELHALGGSTFNIAYIQVRLGFIQPNMERGGLRASDVPVGVLELRLIDLLGAVQFGGCTYIR